MTLQARTPPSPLPKARFIRRRTIWNAESPASLSGFEVAEAEAVVLLGRRADLVQRVAQGEPEALHLVGVVLGMIAGLVRVVLKIREPARVQVP